MTPKRGRGRPPESAEYPVRWQAQLSKRMHADLRERASEERITMAQVAREAIATHLERDLLDEIVITNALAELKKKRKA